jgi:hypothetical protein
VAHLWHCTIAKEGAPPLRFSCKGGPRCSGRNLSVLHYPSWIPSSYPPFAKYAKDGHPLLWWLLQLESRATPSPPNLRFPEQTDAALRLDLAHDNHQNSNLLFGLRQLRNNCSNFIEYLVPALHLTAILCALHGFVSNEGEFRLAVSQILKDGHVVRTVDSLMFYS